MEKAGSRRRGESVNGSGEGMGNPVYKPLYPSEGSADGAKGFQCTAAPESCKAVTRTEKGMRVHVAVCHGVRFQKELFNNEPDPIATQDLPAGIRPRI